MNIKKKISLICFSAMAGAMMINLIDLFFCYGRSHDDKPDVVCRESC